MGHHALAVYSFPGLFNHPLSNRRPGNYQEGDLHPFFILRASRGSCG
ncbi:MAG TPA: hypothetical protein VGF67_28060 [Ktedonobacteraceae bacterium]